MTRREMTFADVVLYMQEHFDGVWAVYEEMVKVAGPTTMIDAAIEYGRRNGEEIVIVDSKRPKEDKQ